MNKLFDFDKGMGKRIAKTKIWQTTKFIKSNCKSFWSLLWIDILSNGFCGKKITITSTGFRP